LGKETIQQYKKLRGDKSTQLFLWQEIQDFMFPNGEHLLRYNTKGQNNRRQIYDDTGERSLDVFAKNLSAIMANPANKFIGFQPEDTTLLDDREVQLFCDEAQRRVLTVFNNPRNRFYDNFYSTVKIIGALGTAALFIDSDDEDVAKFRAEGPKNIDFTEDFSGNVEDVYFEREYTIKVIKGKKWKLPTEVSQLKDDDKLKVLRVIKKNKNYDNKSIKPEDRKYISEYYLLDYDHLLDTKFFNTMPTPVGRWDKLNDEKWGDSPARVALSNVKLCNITDKFMTVAMEKILSPQIIVSSESKFGKMNTSSGSVLTVRGSVNDGYRQEAFAGDPRAPMEWLLYKQQAIRSAFYIDIFQTAETQTMTATEATIRNQEKIKLIAPNVARLQSDILGPAAERVLALLIEQGKIEVPEKLKGQEIKVVYLSPMVQAQKANDAANIMQFVQDLAMVAQVNPDVLDIVDFDNMADELADIRGIPERLLKSDKEIQEVRDAKAKAMQTQQMLSTMQQAGDAGQSIQKASAPPPTAR
jgi:hypothetical protein